MTSERMIIMKKFVSLVLAVIMLGAVLIAAAPAAFAAEPAQTVVNVKEGDEVSYTITLSDVPEPVIGCDFSVYYDDDILEIEKIADYTGSYEEDDWAALINPDLPDEIRGNWTFAKKGVDFSKERTFISVIFKAKKDASTHITYYVRFMYGESAFLEAGKPQITEYSFVCDLTVNGEPVLEAAQPELNTEKTQDIGYFVNSVTGDSADADVNTAIENAPVDTPANNNNNNNNNSGSNGNSGNTASTNADGTPATSSAQTPAADPQNGNASSPSNTAQNNPSGSSPVIWIIIAVVAVAAACGLGYFFFNKKKAPQDGADK